MAVTFTEHTQMAMALSYGAVVSNRWIVQTGDTTAAGVPAGALRYSTPIGKLLGRIAYLGVFSVPLSTPDRAALYAWISNHYGISM